MNTLTKTTIMSAVIVASLGAFGAAYAKEHGKGHGGPRGIIFEQVDTNGDGFITVDEIEASRTARFSNTDTDGDGFLTKDEMKAAMEARRAEHKKAMDAEKGNTRFDRMFDRMDADKDGKIASTEMPGKDASKMIERLDTDKDGKISAAEAEAAKGKKGGRKKKDG